MLYHHFPSICIIFIIKTITRVAWKANKVCDASHLLDLIKNHRQLNCNAVVLCWVVIAFESGDDIVRGTSARTAVEFLPNNIYPSSVDFANSFKTFIKRPSLNRTLSTLLFSVCFCSLSNVHLEFPPLSSVWDCLHLYDNVNSFNFHLADCALVQSDVFVLHHYKIMPRPPLSSVLLWL